MDWAQLCTAMLTDPPGEGALVYIGRHGDEYTWSVLGGDAAAPHGDGPAPEAWLYYSGPWPDAGLRPELNDAFFDDLRAELESMTGDGADRCRWSLDDPWPHGH